MERIDVDSSVIRAVGYDGQTSTLEIEFRNGALYDYRTVPPNVYASLMSAASKGHYFDMAIKGCYDCLRVF